MKKLLMIALLSCSFFTFAEEIPTPTGNTFYNPTLQGFPFLAVDGPEYYQAMSTGSKVDVFYRAESFCKMLNYKRVYRVDVQAIDTDYATVNAMFGVYAHVIEVSEYAGHRPSVYSMITCIY